MSVLIKGMEMPTSCDACRFFAWARGIGQHCAIAPDITFHATLDGFDVRHERKGDCPLVPAADAIEELSKPRWIPVTERLPEDLTRVIVFCEDGVSYGLCEHLIEDDEEVVEWHDFLHYPITPTHWMPLPEPPKEET